MDNILKYLIREEHNILKALELLNGFCEKDALTLFVINKSGTMVGTLTDGDIRRNLVKQHQLYEPVKEIMHKDFCFLDSDNINVENIRQYKERGISLIPVLNYKNEIIDIINLREKESYLPIDAVLMAGGKGERLRPLTEKVPKPLLKVGEKAIIDYNVDRLANFGVKNIFVTVNYLREQIEEHFLTSPSGTTINCIREPKYLGTIGSIKFIKKIHNDVVLVMNSDLFTNIDYEDFYLHFRTNDADMSVAAVPYSISVPYGIFELDGRNIQGVREKPTYNYYANAGIYLIKKEILDLIPDDTFFNATDLIELLIDRGMKVIRFPLTGYWIDIGKKEELMRAKELIKYLFKIND